MKPLNLYKTINGKLTSHAQGRSYHFAYFKIWMNPEFVIQNEVSQKKKNKYCILTYMYGIQKSGIDEPVCRAGNTDADIENGFVDTGGEEEGGMNREQH